MTVDTGLVTSSTLLIVWGVLQSFALEYLWFVKDWFDGLEKRKKQTVNALGLLVITVVLYGLSLAEVINGFTPDLEGALAAATAYFVALGVGQGVHTGTKK
jgi:hypothetical protein